MLRAGLIFFLCCLSPVLGQPLLIAPNAAAPPANQLLVAGNACGPAALINSFRSGSEKWQAALRVLPATDDQSRMLAVIRQYGARPSASLKNHPRWSRRGINLSDLADVANEMTKGLYLPPLTTAVFLPKSKEAPGQLLQRTHRQLASSLEKGMPPVLSVRRFVHRQGEWKVIDAHFVTLIALSAKLPKAATSFPVTYLDPWGGKRCQGEITIPATPGQSGLPANPEACFPQSLIGRERVKSGEPTRLVLSAGIGRW